MGSLENVSSTLTGLRASAPGAPVLDAIADPSAAALALAGEHALLRAEPALDPGAPGYGPRPAPPVWLFLTRGSQQVTMASLLGGGQTQRRVARIVVEEVEARCCGAASCQLKRRRTSAWLALEPAGEDRYLVAEQLTALDTGAEGVTRVATALAELLGAPLASALTATPPSLESEKADEAIGNLSSPQTGRAAGGEGVQDALKVADFARFALRSEGERMVLRDWANDGPSATAPRNLTIGLVLLAASVGCLVQAGFRSANGLADVPIGSIVVAALLGITSYAFIGVSRFAARYRGQSNPLLAIGRDLLVVRPWVGRDGAVDLRPEGRFGAAIPLGEVREARVVPRGEAFAVELDTDHGPIDALEAERDPTARYWAASINRVANECRHPRTTVSARQRARGKK